MPHLVVGGHIYDIEIQIKNRSSQYVADDANAPHIRGIINILIIHHLRCHELGRAEHDAELVRGVVVTSQAKVNDLDLVRVGCNAEYVLRFEVKVKNVATVHESDTITDLSHEVHTLALCQAVVVIDDALKELTTSHAERNRDIMRLFVYFTLFS